MYNEFTERCTFLIDQFVPCAKASDDSNKIRSYIRRIQRQITLTDDKIALQAKLKKALLRDRIILESNLDFQDTRTFYKYVNGRIKNGAPA